MTTAGFSISPTLRAAVLAACLATLQSQAATLDYETTLGVGHSDNIGRTATDQQEEDLAAAGLRFSLDRQGSRLHGNAVGDLAYVEYLDNTYDSELVGNFAGDLRWAFVPERFEWQVADNFGQALNDPFAPATPDNRQNINYFTTGPDVTFAFGSRTRLRLGGRYVLATYEDSPLDSDSIIGDVGLIRLLSAASSVSFNIRAQQVEYDAAALNADYDQNDAFVRFDADGARTHLSVDAGYTQIQRDALDDEDDGVLLRLDVSRRLSAGSTVTVTAGREFANSSSAFATTQGSGLIGLDAVPGRQVAQPFTNTYVTAGWNYSRLRTSLSLLASRTDQDFADVGLLDQTVTQAAAQFRRELSSRASLTLDAQYGQGSFETGGNDYDDMDGGAGFSWRFSQNLSLNVTYNYFKRDSDAPAGDFTENRFWVSIAYGRGTPRATLVRPEFAIDQRT